jgi:tetratricopeptide (TPR) repeat protein
VLEWQRDEPVLWAASPNALPLVQRREFSHALLLPNPFPGNRMAKSCSIALLFFLALGFALGSVPPRASAQDMDETNAKAKQHFERGVELAESNRWAQALSAFRRSATLVPRASTSYNIANALYRLDRPIDGLKELDRYEKFSDVRYNYAAQQRGEALRDLLDAAVAEVELTVRPPDAQLFVDGTLLPAEGIGRRLRLNPGAHSLRLTHDAHEAAFRELKLERGARESLTITLEPLATAPRAVMGVTATSVTASTEPKDDRFVKRPGFWVMIGAIVLVGVGAGVAVALTRRDDSPQCGTTGDCATTSGLTLKSF